MAWEKRIRCEALKARVMSASEAALLIGDGMTVAVGGFTPSGCPKAVPLALAEQVRAGRRPLRLTLLSGASTGEEIDSAWASLGIIARRLPYMTSKTLRDAVNACLWKELNRSLTEFAESRTLASLAEECRDYPAGSWDMYMI